MCFLNYGLPKIWLDQWLKSLVSEDPSNSNMVNPINIVQIWRTPPLAYLLIFAKAIVSQKVSVKDTQNLKSLS